MADKKFGKKRVCGNCEIKFYDLNKESPLTCPQCKSEVLIEDNFSNVQASQAAQHKSKPEPKDEFAEIENNDDGADEEDNIISLDDAEIEEEGSK